MASQTHLQLVPPVLGAAACVASRTNACYIQPADRCSEVWEDTDAIKKLKQDEIELTRKAGESESSRGSVEDVVNLESAGLLDVVEQLCSVTGSDTTHHDLSL